MRWLIVSSQHHSTHGGIGTYVSHFCAAAVDAGWRVELVTRPSPVHPPGVVVHEVTTQDMADEFTERLPALRHMERVRPYRYGMWSLAVAKRLLKIEGDFDAVEFVDTQAEGYVSLASPRTRRHLRQIAGRAIIHAHTPMCVEETINGADANRFGRHLYHEWERIAIASADGVMTASNLLRRRLLMARHSRTIPYPIVRQTSATHHTEQRDRSIVLVGSIQPRKGVHIWAKSLNRTLREHPTVTAILIGPDTFTAPGGERMIEFVRDLIEPAVRERFRWLGPLPHEQVLSHIARAALVVVPSLFDNAPFVVPEALACGTPVIVSDQVGWIEHVPELTTVAANDVDKLAEAQIVALANPRLARDRTGACQDRLFEACNPLKHLAMRAAFIHEMPATSFDREANHAVVDVMDDMSAFLTSVEAAERSVPAAAMTRS